MFTFERTFDFALAHSIVTHPAIYRHMVSDGAPSREAYSLPINDGIWYVIVRQDGEVMGMFIFVTLNSVSCEIHTCLLPKAWGHKARAIYEQGLDWMKEHSPFKKAIGNVPEYNMLALKIAMRAGFQVIGVNEKSISKHGVLRDQIVIGRAI